MNLFDFQALEETTNEANRIAGERHNELIDVLVQISDALDDIARELKGMHYGTIIK